MTPIASLLLSCLLLAVTATGADTQPGSGPAASGKSPASIPAPSDVASKAAHTPSPSPADSTASSTPQTPGNPSSPGLVAHELPDIQGTISIPKDWTLITGKLLEGDVLVASREKIATAEDPWTTGLTMTVDRNGAKDSGQPAGEYALGMATEAREKAGDEAGEIKETRNGKVREFRFEYPVALDTPILVTEVLRADEESGILTVILWQSPKEEATSLKDLRDSILTSIRP
jgi:hypothetical protein